MWVFYGLLPTVIVLFIIVGGIVLLVRRGSEGWNVSFGGVLLGYLATAMLVGVFLVAAGTALLLKAGFAEAGNRDFSYDVQPQTIYSPVTTSGRPEPGTTQIDDRSDTAIRDNVANGISLAFVGAVLFAVHAFGTVILRRRQSQAAPLVTRTYDLLGLALATLGFLGTGAQALNDILRRYVVGGDAVQQWEVRHPGGPLSTAVVLLPLALWFGWRVWQEMASSLTADAAPDASGAAPATDGAT